MTTKLRKTVLKLGCITGIVCVMNCPKAYAETEPIDLVPVAATVTEAVSDPRPVIVPDRDLDQKSVEKLARLLWSSPLRREEYKKELVWLVMNRAAHGDPFGESITDCINRHEFSFFDAHAHRSEENLRIVREAMLEWYSRKDGNNAGVVIRLDAYYMRFTGPENRGLQMLDINMNPINYDPVK